GRESPDSNAESQSGKAANVTPIAATSHTSLPFQTGPIVRKAAPRWRLPRPSIGASIPTPKTKPSSTKNSTQHNTTRANQTVERSIDSSVKYDVAPAAAGASPGTGASGSGLNSWRARCNTNRVQITARTP